MAITPATTTLNHGNVDFFPLSTAFSTACSTDLPA
jgi:hypothetical protein